MTSVLSVKTWCCWWRSVNICYGVSVFRDVTSGVGAVTRGGGKYGRGRGMVQYKTFA